MLFREELGADIDDPVYSKDGTSKLRRLKCYLRTVDDTAAAQAMNALWKCREMRRKKEGREDCVADAHGQLLQRLERIGGTNEGPDPQPKPAVGRAVYRELHDAVIVLSPLDPQPRGYGFEKILDQDVQLLRFERPRLLPCR